MAEETPLQRLRRLESEERARAAGAAPGRVSGGKAAAAGGGAVLALTKGKLAWLFLLGKLGPLAGTLATMALSARLYASMYGARLGVGLVVLILVHELGHGAAARALGLRVGAPIFIPFFGALIALKEQPRSTWVECLVAAAGPAAGLAGAAACAAAAALFPAALPAGLLLALARTTAWINLFNLLPAGGLDGDRVTQPFAPAQWAAALAALIAVCAGASFAAGRLEPVSLFVLLAAGLKAWRRRPAAAKSMVERLSDAGRYAAEAEETTPERRHLAAGLYCCLVGALAFLAAWAGADAVR